ncbi:MAG TPA: hypothetical protein VFL66_12780 [Gaiellaceae bacterium]|nr:hypothetical protein [Gaiellaceae bacterium]
MPPAGGAAVMGTGIVSVGLSLDGDAPLSWALLAVDAALWLGLCAVFARRALRQRRRWLEDARSPAALTAVAGTAVLGARIALTGVGWAAYLLLALAAALWAWLLRPVLGGWRTPTVGVSFVLTVATESLAVLAALLSLERGVAWLDVASLVPLGLGLAAYVFVLLRFDLRQLLVGRGDQWVAGGALAIATLACARVAAAAATGPLRGARGVLEDASLALWAAAAAWLPALLAAELVRPRPGYDTRRWSTVFPFGMYAVCSFAVGDVTGIGGLTDFARVWIWVAFAVWAVVFAAMLRRGLAVARG